MAGRARSSKPAEKEVNRGGGLAKREGPPRESRRRTKINLIGIRMPGRHVLKMHAFNLFSADDLRISWFFLLVQSIFVAALLV